MRHGAQLSSQQIGPYRIEGFLGAGGMGEVFRARSATLPDPVALKRIRAAVAQDPRRRRRVLREAALVARLHHPAVVRIHDSFEAAGDAWIAMELVPGPTLAQRLRQGVLPWPEALELGRWITAGLQAAHEEGIIHYDLKVENVMVTPEGLAKIVDFGIARRLGEAPPSSAGRVVGTPRILSPEQVMGLEADPRSDLFALGVLFYEILTGTSPFAGEPGEPVHRILARICTLCPVPLDRLDRLDRRVAPIPRWVARLVEALLEKDPRHRPRNAAEVKDYLERVLQAWPSEPALAAGIPVPPLKFGEFGEFGGSTTASTTQSTNGEGLAEGRVEAQT